MNPRTLNEIYETTYRKDRAHLTWRNWWLRAWKHHISIYSSLQWRMIPIAVRGKRPLRSDFNYVSHGAAGPYLTQAEALEWVAKGFNLAVAAGPSRIVWLDIDDPAQHLPKLHRGLLMRTARGYAAPLRTDSSFTELIKLKLKENGYDCRDDVAYELVPLSVTCTRDHNLSGEIHLGPQQPCIDGGAHDYRVREFITPPSNPILSFRQFLSFVA